MWLFTKTFFCSAVEDKDDSESIMVRFRSRKHVTAFCDKYKFPVENVREDAGTDYRFRIFISRGVFSEIVEREAQAIDYTNFKSAVSDGKQWPNWKDRYHYHDEEDEALLHVWSAMANLQWFEESKEKNLQVHNSVSGRCIPGKLEETEIHGREITAQWFEEM